MKLFKKFGAVASALVFVSFICLNVNVAFAQAATVENQENISTPSTPSSTQETNEAPETSTAINTFNLKTSNDFCGYAVDVSHHNGNVDWGKLKNQGVKYGLVRDGFGNGGNQKDKKLDQNYDNATANGVPIGLYHYSYMSSAQDSINEANYCLSILNGRGANKIVAYDLEDNSIIKAGCSKAEITQGAINFCNIMRSNGCIPMVYANHNWFTNYIDYNQIKNNGIKIWYAQYVNGDQVMDLNTPAPDFSRTYFSKEGRDCEIFQYSSHGVVDGNGSQYIDLNALYNVFW